MENNSLLEIKTHKVIDIASLKMNVLVIGRNKDEAEKMKKRIYDVKFGKMYSAYPELKGKLNKDV